MSCDEMSPKLYPDGYRPLNFCRACGRDCTRPDLFEEHRGSDDEDGRRCLSEEEMQAKGWSRYSEEELLRSSRHHRRAGTGVALWSDSVVLRRVHENHIPTDHETAVGMPDAAAAEDSRPVEEP